jgi:hypothetical protein
MSAFSRFVVILWKTFSSVAETGINEHWMILEVLIKFKILLLHFQLFLILQWSGYKIFHVQYKLLEKYYWERLCTVFVWWANKGNEWSETSGFMWLYNVKNHNAKKSGKTWNCSFNLLLFNLAVWWCNLWKWFCRRRRTVWLWNTRGAVLSYDRIFILVSSRILRLFVCILGMWSFSRQML